MQNARVSLSENASKAVVDIAIAGEGLGAALLVAYALQAGKSVAWIDAEPTRGRSARLNEPTLVTPLLLPLLGERGKLYSGARTAFSQGGLDWRRAWQRKSETPFQLRYLFEGSSTQTEAGALVTLAQRSLELYLGIGGRINLSRHLNKTGMSILVNDTNPSALLKLQAAADAAQLPLVELDRPIGAGRQLFCQQAWLIPNVSAMASAALAAAQGERLLMRDKILSASREEGTWLIGTPAETIRAATVILTTPAWLSVFAVAEGQRLPFGRVSVAQRTYAPLLPGIGPILHATGKFKLIPTSRGTAVRLSPRLHPTEHSAEKAIHQIVRTCFPGVLGEPRDEVRIDEDWQAPDGLPCFGPIPGEEGLWIMHVRSDLEASVAPLLARAMLVALDGRQLAELDKLFGVQRLISSRPVTQPAAAPAN